MREKQKLAARSEGPRPRPGPTEGKRLRFTMKTGCETSVGTKVALGTKRQAGQSFENTFEANQNIYIYIYIY